MENGAHIKTESYGTKELSSLVILQPFVELAEGQ